MRRACGFNANGRISEIGFAGYGLTQRAVMPAPFRSAPTPKPSPVSRCRSAPVPDRGGLRNGFFFAPMKYVGGPIPRTPEAPVGFTVRGYDAAGNLIYQTPKTIREYDAQQNRCYTDPAGKRVVFALAGKTPTPDQCARGVAWNW